jgi:V8-like Glu-specific endopeptidase
MPLRLRESGKVSVGERLAVIGYPSGLPLKIADDGVVRRLEKHFFVTNLDTYHGNSGSPVLNAATGVVEGILVRGDEDFVKSSQGCQISKTCSSTGCRGEDVSYITDVKKD